MVEMRSAWKTQKYPIFTRIMDKASRWGDFNGLESLIPTALQFSVIGYPFVLPDMIGGNTYGLREKPSRELFIRWIQVTSFMPVMQFSITPWDYDDEVINITRAFADFHQTIVYEAVVEAASDYIDGKSSHALVSPIWMIAGDEPDAYRCSDQFMIGKKYLVAPVLKEGQRQRDIYLPAGTGSTPILWKDMLTLEVVEGGKWLRDYDVELKDISWWSVEKP